MFNAAPRRQLSDFLKNCRLRLAPTDVGLPLVGNRRTGGLRREDVAALAGVSLTWYTWLEQGRDVTLSTRVLECISGALKLSEDERDYLFGLAQNRSPPQTPAGAVEVRPPVLRALHSLSLPAQILTARWDVIAWNRLAAITFRDYAQVPVEQRNILRLLLTTPEYQCDPQAFETLARRVVAKFRVDYSRAAGDPSFDDLIEQMLDISPIFAKVWRIQEIANQSEALAVILHPAVGRLTFEQTSYAVEGAPSLRLFLFVPHDDETVAGFTRLAEADPPLVPLGPVGGSLPLFTGVLE